jgi:ribosomal protein L24E
MYDTAPTCRHCGEPIEPSRLFGWVHTANDVNHFCTTSKVNEYAEPAA